MTSYTTTFGGQNINPAQVAYQAISLTANIELAWPNIANPGVNVVAQKMDVTASGAGLNITMPPANEVSVGQDAYFYNIGSYSFSVLDNGGGVIAVVPSGTAWFVYLTDNSDDAGAWNSIQQGALTSSVQAASLAGLGLVALATLLNQSHPVSTKNASYSVGANDRAQLLDSTGGAITFSFATSVTLGNNWFCLVRNDGSGSLTLDPNGSETIDGQSTKILAIGESCFVICDGAALKTVGYGRNSTTSTTAVIISGGGGAGDQSLSTSEVQAEIQQYNGTLTGDRNYEYGTVAGFWFVYNNLTLGGNTATWRVDMSDMGVTSSDIPAGTRAIIISNGTNMFLAVSSAGGTVTSVGTGTGLTGGPITTTGTVAIANTGVTAGDYQNPSLTINAQGQITDAVSGQQVSIISTNTLAVAGNVYACNTSGAGFTLTLPASPTKGQTVGVIDARQTFDANSLTIGRNSSPIMALAEDMTISTENANFTFEYIDATLGWTIIGG